MHACSYHHPSSHHTPIFLHNPQIDPSGGTDANVTCIQTYCQDAVFACLKDKMCRKALDCLGECDEIEDPSPDKVGKENDIYTYRELAFTCFPPPPSRRRHRLDYRIVQPCA